MTMLRALILFTVVAVAGPAEATVTSTFVGWSEDGTYHVERVENTSLLRRVGSDFVSVPYYLFVPAREGVRPTWPERIARYPKRDERHAVVQPEALGVDDAAALAAVRALVKAPAPSKTGPRGQTLTVEQRGWDSIHVITDGRRVLPMRPSGEGYAIRDIYWRADGGAVAFVAEYTGGDKIRQGNTTVFAYDLTRYFVAGGDRKAATALRKAAARAGKRKEWDTALVELQEAVNLDPSFVEAQYDLAAAAARRGDLVTVQRALQALIDVKHPSAAAALTKAKKDPAFDRAMTSDAVRALLGVDAFAKLTPEQRIAGTWTFEGGGCDASWLTLTLGKKGKASLRVRSACVPEHAREWDRTRTFKGTWSPDAAGARIRFKLRPNDEVPDFTDATAEVRTCPEGWCLFVTRTATTHGPFHRGEPE